MKLKLVDVTTNAGYRELGTCELCFHTAYVEDPVYVFEKENGERVEVDGYYYDWGDYDEVDFGNILDFADYIRQQEFDDDLILNYEWLSNLEWEYNEWLEKKENKNK